MRIFFSPFFHLFISSVHHSNVVLLISLRNNNYLKGSTCKLVSQHPDKGYSEPKYQDIKIRI